MVYGRILFCSTGVCGTFGSSNVNLIGTAGDSVYSARCFRVPFIIYGIQVFKNFPCKFIVFFKDPTNVVSYFEDIWQETNLLINRLFRART